MPTYEYYKDTYKGISIQEKDWERLALRASSYISSIAPNAKGESLEMAICSVAEAWQTNEQGGDVISQTVGSWSRTFQKATKSDNMRLFEAARIYLGDSAKTVRWV